VKLCRIPLLVLGLLAFSAHATDDPWEGFNRKVFAFNEGADRIVLKPLAQGYEAGVPLPARVAFTNFVGNFGDIGNAFNNLLQGKVGDALSDVGRILVNTTLGIAGTIDVASEMGLAKHNEDFGQTLGRWGVETGPYLVLPILGPSTLRDTAALPVDYYSNGRDWVIDSVAVRNSITGLNVVSIRAGLLGADTALQEAALDKYSFVRNFFLQRRLNQVFDGNPPRPKQDDADEDWRDDDASDAAPNPAPASASDQKEQE
jgi:phospholipid-binding lipoprotein MlaA